MADTEPPRPKVRSFLKNKPNWLKNSEVKGESTTKRSAEAPEDLFSRSRDTYEELQALKEQRRKLKEERRQKASSERPEAKRRRVSDEGISTKETGNSLHGKSGSEEPHNSAGIELISTEPPAKGTSASKPTIIDLDDSEDDEQEVQYSNTRSYGSPVKNPQIPPPSRVTRSSPRNKRWKDGLHDLDLEPSLPRKRKPIPLPEDDEEEELDPELAARARARARPQASTAGTASRAAAATAVNPTTAAADEPDPVISVLIQPRIPGTEPLLVKRRYRQRIKECREAWCARQPANLSAAGLTAADVIFAHRGRRIFDWSSIKSIGIALGADGEPLFPPTDVGGRPEPADQIVLVATTEALLAADRRAEEQEREKRERGERSEDEEGALAAPQPAQPKEATIRLVLKAKGHEDFKLIVRPTSTFGHIAHAFKQERKIAAALHVSLSFDGDVLDPKGRVEDGDFEDMDCIEVLIR